MSKGRYASPRAGAFLRDLVVMLFLFVAAGTLAFGAIYWIQQRGADAAPATESTSTSTTVTTRPPPTTAPETSTTVVATTVTTVPSLRPNSQVRVLVLNAVGRSGIAGELSATLTEAGYVVDTPDNYSGELERSKVWFKQGFTAEALEIAQYVPDADVELNPDSQAEADIVIVLGPTYQG